MPGAQTYIKALVAGAALCVGGPALVYYVTPTEEEIFKKYNPDLQKRALATRDQKQKDFENFINQLKEASKSDKPIWIVQKEMEKKAERERARALREGNDTLQAEAERRRAEIRSSTQ